MGGGGTSEATTRGPNVATWLEKNTEGMVGLQKWQCLNPALPTKAGIERLHWVVLARLIGFRLDPRSVVGSRQDRQNRTCHGRACVLVGAAQAKGRPHGVGPILGGGTASMGASSLLPPSGTVPRHHAPLCPSQFPLPALGRSHLLLLLLGTPLPSHRTASLQVRLAVGMERNRFQGRSRPWLPVATGAAQVWTCTFWCAALRMAKATMERASAIACNVYVSEGRDRKVLKALEERAMRLGAAICANVFVDAAYHRTGYTFVAPWSRSERFAEDVADFSACAVEHVDLRNHVAAHPRLGAVDHVLCAPIPPRSGDDVRTWSARDVALRVAEGLAKKTNVSVAVYGDADEQGRSLADVRRALGYFQGATDGVWKGCLNLPAGAEQLLQFGPKTPPDNSGVTVVGACPWVVNYNVRMQTTDLQKAARVAKKVSARGGGMPGVQAMALPHRDGVEVACNLLFPEVAGPEDVQRKVEELGKEMGIPVDVGYVIGKTPRQLLEMAMRGVQDQEGDPEREERDGAPERM